MNPNLPLTLTPILALSPSVTPRRDQDPEDSVVKEESSEDESDESDEDDEEEEEEDDDDSEDSAQDLD